MTDIETFKSLLEGVQLLCVITIGSDWRRPGRWSHWPLAEQLVFTLQPPCSPGTGGIVYMSAPSDLAAMFVFNLATTATIYYTISSFFLMISEL